MSFVGTSSLALEMAGSHTIQTRLSVTNGGTLSEPVTVDIAALPGGTASTPGDYTLTTTSVTFPAGSVDGTMRPVDLVVVSDEVLEENESVSFAIDAPRRWH